jgi:hypothetical protein
VVSLGAVWEYEDEEDRHNNGVAFEEPIPKRKKTTTSERSQSMKIPSTSITQWKDDGDGTANKYGQDYEQASQLTTPAASGKQKKDGKAGPLALKSKAKQTRPFKNPTITKPLAAREKETARDAYRLKPIISHSSWRSTEDNLKSTSVVLAKTTMEKLAAFRFKLALDPRAVTVAHPTHHEIVDREDGLLRRNFGEATHPSSDYDVSGDAFNEALWAVKADAEFKSGNQSPTEPVATPNVVADGSEKPAQRQPGVESDIFDSERELVAGRLGHKGLVLTNQPPKRLSHDCYEPTPGKMRVFNDLIKSAESKLGKLAQTDFNYMKPTIVPPHGPRSQSKDVEDIEMGDRIIVEEPPHLSNELLHSNQLAQESGVDNYDPHNRSTHHPEAYERQNSEVGSMLLVTPNAPPSSQDNNQDELLKQKESFIVHRTFGQWNTNIQVDRSHIDEPETLSKEASRDLRGSDEFDQGLDDDDLLAIVLDSVIPQTPMKVQPEQQKNPTICGRFLLPSTPAEPNFRVPNALTPRNPTTLDIINLNSSPAQIVPDPDDEYPMDDEDEEEMLKLLELGAAVKESFAPPESVQHALHLLEEGEVFDSSLQFSPPKSQTSGTSPSKVTRSHRTDKARASRSPRLRKDSLPLEEEEDWSFMRSEKDVNDIETRIMSDHFCEPHAPVVRSSRPRRASSTRNKRSVADPPDVQTPSTPDTFVSSFDDSHEYEPMNPFARPDFPALVLDRSPVVGFSAQTYLRTCFRIGEMFKEGVRCGSLAQDAVIELFARVVFSSRETGSTKQHFQFADLWHDRPPYPNGLLADYKTTRLAESESKVFLGESGKMARCLGRFKRDVKSSVRVLHIINIRETDWEEIRWTKEIVSHGQVKTDKSWFSGEAMS